MTLDSWTTGDTITELNANKRGIRRGTTTDRDNLAASAVTIGDHFFNETEQCTQVLVKTSGGNIWMNVGRVQLQHSSDEVTVTGTTKTLRKTKYIIKHTSTWYGFLLNIVVRMKTSSGTGYVRVRIDGAGTDSLVLSSTATSYEVQQGTIDTSALGAGYHSLEFYMDGLGGSDTAYMSICEVWGS
jgi:hypothetical protein